MFLKLSIILFVTSIAFAQTESEVDAAGKGSKESSAHCLTEVANLLKAGTVSTADRPKLQSFIDEGRSFGGDLNDRKSTISSYLEKKYSQEFEVMKKHNIKFEVTDCALGGEFFYPPENRLVICAKKSVITGTEVSKSFEHEFLHFLQSNKVATRSELTKKLLTISKNGKEHVPEMLCNHTQPIAFNEAVQRHMNKISDSLKKLPPEQVVIQKSLDGLEKIYNFELDRDGNLVYEPKAPDTEKKLLEYFGDMAGRDRAVIGATVEATLSVEFAQYIRENKSCETTTKESLNSCFAAFRDQIAQLTLKQRKDLNFRPFFNRGYVENRCATGLQKYCDEIQGNAQTAIRGFNNFELLSRNGLRSQCESSLGKVYGQKASTPEQVEAAIFTSVRRSVSLSSVYGAGFSLLGNYNYPLFDVKYCKNPPEWSFFESGCPNFDPSTHVSSKNSSSTSAPSKAANDGNAKGRN